MASRPLIPERWSSLMPETAVFVNQKRVARGSSQMSTRFSVPEFLGHKLLELQEEHDYIENVRRHGLPALSKRIWGQELEEVESEVDKVEQGIINELLVLRMQKRLIQEDMDDECNFDTDVSREQLDKAYSEAIMHKVKGASLARKKKKSNQNAFRTAVGERYHAFKEFEEDDKDQWAWCPVTGWNHVPDVKAAHIVPKSLDFVGLTYLFGGNGEKILSDPRNGIMLHKNIEGALHSGNVVIVPLPSAHKGPVEWKLVVTNTSLLNQLMGTTGQGFVKWKDIDGKTLEFPNEKRPARRYLYFRYTITFLWCKREGRLDGWNKNADTNGCMWATPGPYLRRNMLVAMAKLVSHTALPEGFYEENTFTDVDPECQVPLRTEENYTMELALRLRELREETAAGRNQPGKVYWEDENEDGDDENDNEYDE